VPLPSCATRNGGGVAFGSGIAKNDLFYGASRVGDHKENVAACDLFMRLSRACEIIAKSLGPDEFPTPRSREDGYSGLPLVFKRMSDIKERFAGNDDEESLIERQLLTRSSVITPVP
jgi:hypothetical protein